MDSSRECVFVMTSDQTVSKPPVSTSFAPDAEVRMMLDPAGNKAMPLSRPFAAAEFVRRSLRLPV